MMQKTLAALLITAALFLTGCTGTPAESSPKPAENAAVSLSVGAKTVEGLYTGQTLDRLPDGEGVFTAGKPISIPKNYYPDDNEAKAPRVSWRSSANLLFSNWLNYFVYQTTPYDLNEIDLEKKKQQN